MRRAPVACRRRALQGGRLFRGFARAAGQGDVYHGARGDAAGHRAGVDTVKAAALQTTQRLYEFMDPRVSKTRGLVRVAELNDMELENICVFGDADNDTCMVADAGVGVAMANGSDATRAAAEFTGASNDKDGIAIFIEEHLL